MTRFTQLTLGAAGLTAFGIGLAIATVPETFYAGYGIAIRTEPAALSELRAPGTNLAMLGAVILAGALRPAMARLSAALGTLVFLAFATGRLLSLTLDGWPGDSIATALALELGIGILCAFAWRSLGRRPAAPGALALYPN